MTKGTREGSDPAGLLEQITAGAEGDDAQLRALAEAIAREVRLPADAFVVGEPVQVTAIDYGGNPRAGLLATCARAGERHVVGFGDVVFSPGTGGARFSAVYRTWLGLMPHGAGPGSPARPQKRHKAEAADIELSRPLDLVVLALKSKAIRCRVLGTERVITLRTAVRYEVPGEIITVLPARQWTHSGHPYLSGEVKSSRLDERALGLVPLALKPKGDWDPEEEYWGEEGEPLEEWAKPIVARGKRPAFEMEQVIPGQDPEDLDTDPIIEASELNAAGDRGAAEELLMKTLAEDLRCLDAHAHLGNFEFEHRPKQAMRHYTRRHRRPRSRPRLRRRVAMGARRPLLLAPRRLQGSGQDVHANALAEPLRQPGRPLQPHGRGGGAQLGGVREQGMNGDVLLS